MKAFCSWSGGKDSCLALNRAARNGYEITHLLTMFDETGERSRSHSISREMMRAQAAAIGLELVLPSASWQNYESVFVEELKRFKSQNIEAAIFGDIDLQAHRDWEEKVCEAAKIEAVLPLWNENRLDLVNEFIGEGFRSVVICVNEKFLPKEFCGRIFDEQFVRDLPEGVDACGENGEFHTFVFDGELFKDPVPYKIDEIYHHAPVFPSGDAASFYYAKLIL
ncbi:MAG: diphthine--ammonia ligase [Acidobacteriota bacterium]|nr:diphthine--ammonia ligase [Acidobacteriota bacterium]